MNPFPLNKFIQKVAVATNRKTKEVTFSHAEAVEISVAITEMLTDRVDLLQKIEDLRTRSDEVITVKIDGGTLK